MSILFCLSMERINLIIAAYSGGSIPLVCLASLVAVAYSTPSVFVISIPLSETTEMSKLVKIKPGGSKIDKDLDEAGVGKPTEKILEKKIDSDELISKSLEKKEELDKLIKETEK